MSFVGGSWFNSGEEPFELKNCLLLDGVNDFVSITSSLTGLKTLQFWVKWSVIVSWNPLFCVPSSNYFGAWRNNPLFYLGAGSNYFASTFTPLTNTAYHIVFRYNSADLRWNIWINGTKYTVGTLLASTTTEFIDLGRISSNVGVTSAANGKFTEVALWDVALSDVDIAGLYNSGLGDYASNYSPSNLKLYWRLNQNSGTTALDSSGNGLNGTLNNFTGTFWTTW